MLMFGCHLQKSVRHTAYHEAGHALVALFTPGADPLHKATINPRGPALGLTWQMPPADEYSRSLTQLRASVDVCMGGQVRASNLNFQTLGFFICAARIRALVCMHGVMHMHIVADVSHSFLKR
jgi:hypothetical protein